MKLGFALKKTKKSVLQSGGAGAPGANGDGAGGAPYAVAGVFSSALPAKQTIEKVFVTDFDPNARAAVEFDKDGNVKKALVIPLIKANAWKGEAPDGGSSESANSSSSSGGDGASNGAGKSTQQASSKGDESMLTADELAAKELLAHAKSLVEGGAKSGSSSSHAADLIIPMNGKLQDEGDDTNGAVTNDSKTSKRESEEDEKTKEIKKKLFNFENQEKNRKLQQQQGSDAPPTAPILRQNVVPGMDALEDTNEKYRLDVSMRPDELDVHSAAYDMVPIEDFGAALLRGMGWKGNVDKDDKGAEPKPRHKLLGLGATIRPPIPGELKNTHRKKFSQQQPAQSRGTNDDSNPRHSGLNHTEASSNKEQKKKQRSSRSPSPRRSSDDSRQSGKDSKQESRDRRRCSSRDRHRSSRDDKEDRSRRRDEERHASQSSSRRRSPSREGGRGRDRSSDRNSKRDRDSERRSDRRREDDRRKRSRSRERSSDRKRSSRR